MKNKYPIYLWDHKEACKLYCIVSDDTFITVNSTYGFDSISINEDAAHAITKILSAPCKPTNQRTFSDFYNLALKHFKRYLHKNVTAQN